MSVLHFLVYFSAVFFVVLIAARLIRIATAPIHLRWELYPVPHERGKASYGGSKLEDFEWWNNKHVKKDMLNEAKVMGSEIIFLKAVWEHNRKLWYGSFPLHFGLYLLIGAMFLLIISGILTASGVAVTAEASGFPGFLAGFITAIAWVGAITGTVGALVMFTLRTFDKNLSKYSSPSHYFNIAVLGVIYVSQLLWLVNSGDFAGQAASIYAALMTGSALPQLPASALVNAYSVVFFLFYLPLTHMTHFCTKYFTYHKVRWEDEENIKGSKMNKKLMTQLNYPVSWAAPHIGADGKKTWLAIATEAPSEEKK